MRTLKTILLITALLIGANMTAQKFYTDTSTGYSYTNNGKPVSSFYVISTKSVEKVYKQLRKLGYSDLSVKKSDVLTHTKPVISNSQMNSAVFNPVVSNSQFVTMLNAQGKTVTTATGYVFMIEHSEGYSTVLVSRKFKLKMVEDL